MTCRTDRTQQLDHMVDPQKLVLGLTNTPKPVSSGAASQWQASVHKLVLGLTNRHVLVMFHN